MASEREFNLQRRALLRFFFCASFEGKILGHLYRREDTKFADEILISPHKYPNLGIYPGSAMDMVILAGFWVPE